MDQGWDHTENEDKLLLAQTLLMNRDMGTVMELEMRIDSVAGIGCSDNVSGSGDGIISLNTEYAKHLSSIVINNYNLLFGLSPVPFKFPFLFHYINQLNLLYSCISEICKICNSKCKCECTCICDSDCTSFTICLCLCNCTKGDGKECCICICKHGDTCKCVCICICKDEKCCCQSGTSHRCKECLKINLSRLMYEICQIINEIRCILCYISRIENKCCLCSCCVNGRCDGSCWEPCGSGSSTGCCCCSCCPSGCSRESCESNCCCKDGKINYSSIMSRIHWIESLFKEVGKKILQLTKMNYSLSFYCNKSKPEGCKCCNCKDKIEGLISNIEKAGQYYSSFASIIGDIRMLVDYKTFCPQANEIIDKLKMSAKPLLNKLTEINSQVLINVDLTRISDQLLLGVYSHYCIFQCFLAMYILLQSSSKMYSILNIIETTSDCYCVQNFKPNNNNGFKITDFYQYLIKCCTKNTKELDKLFIKNDGNQSCLCLVIKYVLYPGYIKSMYCMRQVYYETLSKQTREFLANNHSAVKIKEVGKMSFLIMNLIYKILFIIESNCYSKGTWCFCGNSNDIYYPYLISIILYVSSLMENIWTIDHLSIVSAIESLSSLLSEYQSIHVYSNYGSGESIRDVSGLDLSKLKSSSITLMQYINTISITTITSNSNSNSQIVLHTVITKSQGMVVNTSLKSFFKSVLSSISILIATPLFSLVYSNFSGLAFYINENSKIIGVSSGFLRAGLFSISKKYLECTKKKECAYPKSKELKICICGKINYLSLTITMKIVRCVLSSVIIDLITNKCIKLYKIINDMNRIIINNTELILRMTKSNVINTSKSYPQINNVNNIENIGVTNVETRNWGYDTKYEHDVTNDRGFTRGDGYPNLSDPSYTFSHLPIFP